MPFAVTKALKRILSPFGYGASDASHRIVCLVQQGIPASLDPELREQELKQRQAGWFCCNIPQNSLHQAVLEPEPDSCCRFLNCFAQLTASHWSDVHYARLK